MKIIVLEKGKGIGKEQPATTREKIIIIYCVCDSRH